MPQEEWNSSFYLVQLGQLLEGDSNFSPIPKYIVAWAGECEKAANYFQACEMEINLFTQYCLYLPYLFLCNKDPLRTELSSCWGGMEISETWIIVDL